MKRKITYQVLSKLFISDKDKDAMDFSLDVTTIANKMVHHPTIFKVRGNTVVFRTLTHEAFVSMPDDRHERVPGITMHDIRIAYRLEKLWEKYWAQGKARMPRKGWKWTGRKRASVGAWGKLYARLSLNWRAQMAGAVRRLHEKLHPNGGTEKKKNRKKKKTPRWKLFVWKNRARRERKAVAEAAASANAANLGETSAT